MSRTAPVDGLTYLRAVVDGTVAPPPAAAMLGFDLVAAQPGRVELGFTPVAAMSNPIGVVFGGVCAAVCDAACACAVLSRLSGSARHTSQNLNVSFARPVTVDIGRLTCRADVLRLGRRTALAQASLHDCHGRLLVHATSTFVITSTDSKEQP